MQDAPNRYSVHTLDNDQAGMIELAEEPQPGDFVTLPHDRWMRVLSVVPLARIAFVDGAVQAMLRVEFSDGVPLVAPPADDEPK